MLLDTASLYFRAFYGMPDSLRAPDGTPVNAVRGLLDFTARLVTDYRPDRLVACLDASWRPSWRVELLPSYKAHRAVEVVAHEAGTTDAPVEEAEDTPDDLEVQVPIIIDVLEAFGIAALGVEDFEADDVIGTLATSAPGPVNIVTGDRDLFQLVDDARGVRVLYTARGVGRHDVVDEAWVAAKYAIPGRSYADFATLRGDSSDGLPGVKGIGDKTAATLLTTYESLDAVVAAAHDADSPMAAPVRRKILDGLDYLGVAPLVVAVAKDVPVPDGFDDTLPSAPADPERLDELTARWGLGTSVDRLRTALDRG
jgi:5'-3' exonuclease